MVDKAWNPYLMESCSRYLLGLGMDKPALAPGVDRIEQAKLDFCDLEAQVCWLADRLSEARILVGQKECMLCPRMSFANCSRCWRARAAQAVREERHAQ